MDLWSDAAQRVMCVSMNSKYDGEEEWEQRPGGTKRSRNNTNSGVVQ